MNRDTRVVGDELEAYRVSAQMPADPVENKIHEDALAQAMGFRGGLVPGVTVYAWMTHPIVEALGTAWLERGTFSARFAKPVYFGEDVDVRATMVERTEASMTFQVRVVDGRGETCATATLGLPRESPRGTPVVSTYPVAPLPDERPLVSRTLLASRSVLGTPELMLDEAAAQAFLERVREPLAIYREAGGPAHPGLYLDLANRTLNRNVRVSPWIHVESQGRHLSVARVGERIEARAKVAGLFERKGHEFVELDILLVAEGARPIASIRHVAIYQLRGAAEASAAS
ncbi:MAG TPA: hotdog fold domain-containing protein [Candidatus Methylomirabilis sp.]|nr:hotdog fold domain-containing protein [Candidatus Methylomirabilis sp.]